MVDLTIPAVLFAGFISFISPCVLPLVPPYLCYLAGTTFEQVIARESAAIVARREVAAALLFVAGFTTVFVALGAGASAIGGILRAYSDVLAMVAGIAIILMGLHFLGVFRLPFLNTTARMEVDKPVGLWGAYAMGLAFAFGWTPCIGPILGGILTLAGASGTLAQGVGLLGVYSLGLAVPFLLAALLLGPFMAFSKGFRRYLPWVERVAGVILVVAGVLMVTGTYTALNTYLIKITPDWLISRL